MKVQGKEKDKYIIALAGNPNVGKSTIFNSLTGMHQHTGNWPGKTVANATGTVEYRNTRFELVDIPGTYSIMSNSEEEEIARNYICFGNPDATIVVLDATNIEKNLNLLLQILEITNNVIVCVNLLDEAKKKGIGIDFKRLEEILGIPVVGTIAQKKRTLTKLKEEIYNITKNKLEKEKNIVKYDEEIEDYINKIENILKKSYNNLNKKMLRWVSLKILEGNKKIIEKISKEFEINLNHQEISELIDKIKEKEEKENQKIKEKIVENIISKAEEISKEVCTYKNKEYYKKQRKIDKVLTSKKWGIPIMLIFLALIFWITIIGANYPSQVLFNLFGWLQEKILYGLNYINCPSWIVDLLVNGIYQTLTWVISVMLPPMAIFFPLFTFLEDLGYLPRIAFNMDGFFKKVCCSGKQMITMCMGFGCNACGVTGCRIIDSPRERLIAILTNNLVPCNRKISISNNNSQHIYSGNNAGNRSIFFINTNSSSSNYFRNICKSNNFKNTIKNNIKRNAIIICTRTPTI